ncbi:MAG: tryptophan--tRNA ligase [Cyanobacteria bacterium QS_8_64_29]|nr:MAG: tryptophan--tRNA ligase [Cyanobacteria bacterium QS_8_64_29]
MAQQRAFSGVQPTGNLHLGNYLGAICNWVERQQAYDSLFCIVDLHATTVPRDPQTLAEETYAIAGLYLACGIDPQQATIFVQSHVPAHSELAWLFNCITPIGWLESMVQYKEKARRQGENVGAGLLDYPVLMAADILLYDTDIVPVGEDQQQHLELTRDIAARLNDNFAAPEAPLLKQPQPLIGQQGAKIMSLTDGRSKMSKSDPAEQSRINLLDPPETIERKVKRAKTDPTRGLTFDDPERPECHNLLTLYMLLSGQSKAQVADECREMGWGQFKPLLADAAVEALEPIQREYHALRRDRAYLDSVLRAGRERAAATAEQTLARVKDALGYLPPR